MVDVRPFRAITYTTKAGKIEQLITQPYDKIDIATQKAYYARSPYNYCRLILPMENNKYNVADNRLEQWLKEGAMIKELQPAIFISRQEFNLKGNQYNRLGIIAALRLYPYSENMVFPHEATYKAPKVDRLNMLRTVQKDLEPVFLMYEDPEESTIKFMIKVSRRLPMIKLTDELGVKHTIWKVTSPQEISEIRTVLAPKLMVINDGHHRYESAVAYRDEIRSKGNWTDDNAFNFHMCYMVPIQQEGLIVLPTHRLLKNNHKLTRQVLDDLSRFFEITEIKPTTEAIEEFLHNHIGEHAFCAYDGSIAWGLTLIHNESIYEFINTNTSIETKIFDVVILRDIVFKQVLKTGQLDINDNIVYERWTKDAMIKVDKAEASIAFLVNPIPAKTVAEVAFQHEVLPEKSTDFYPKLVSGLVLMDISASEKLHA